MFANVKKAKVFFVYINILIKNICMYLGDLASKTRSARAINPLEFVGFFLIS